MNTLLSDEEDTIEFIREVEEFVRKNAISDSRFGLDVMNDEHFVFNLRQSRVPRRSTRKQIRDYMKTHDFKVALNG
jgi:hypothetical protein